MMPEDFLAVLNKQQNTNVKSSVIILLTIAFQRVITKLLKPRQLDFRI